MIFILNESSLNLDYKICVVYFYSQWLGSHKKNIINLRKIQDIFLFNCFAVDIDYFEEFILRYNLISIPTFLIFKNGEEINRFGQILEFDQFKKQFIFQDNDISI